MSDDLTLPGDMPGLLRYTSPLGGDYLTVLAVDNGEALVVVGDDNGDHDVRWVSLSDLTLDLAEPTGLVHAIAWVEDQVGVLTEAQARAMSYILRHCFRDDFGDTKMDEECVATLRALCLRLGGRTP